MTGKKTLEAYGLVAEFFENLDSDPPIYHFVIMRKGSIEILGWGQEHSAEAAEQAAKECMENVSGQSSAAG
ncbi:MAG TPA: hypothetical protein VMZ25_01130 [Terriglobales bacterium]|nr:hypothetical protein [Terriglobales bacterium]